MVRILARSCFRSLERAQAYRQGKAKQTRKFAAVKRMIKPSDPRL